MGDSFNSESFAGPGGDECDGKKMRKESLRAEMCEVASRISFQHGPRIVDAILEQYDVTLK